MCDTTPHPFRSLIESGVRSIAASIPIAASLGQAWNEYETHLMGKRIQELFDNVKSVMRDLHQRLDIHEDLIAKCRDQFPSLLEMTIDKVRREFSDEKRRLYAHLLARLVLDGGARSYDEKVTLIESLDALTELDLMVLELFKGNPEVTVKNLDLGPLGLSGDVNEQLQQLACCLSKLESRGLILTTFTHTGLVITPDGVEQWLARWSETKYRVLPMGQKVIDALFD